MGAPKVKRSSSRVKRPSPFLMTCMIHFEAFRCSEAFTHFDEIAETLSCFQCADFQAGVCPGDYLFGRAVLACMQEHTDGGPMGFIGVENPEGLH